MDTLKYPCTFEELTEEEKKAFSLLGDYYSKHELDVVRVIPGNYVVQRQVIKYGSEIYNFKPRPEDIWLVGFPRSGTTLMQEILYILGTNFDYEKAGSEIMDVRFPFLQHVFIMTDKQLEHYKRMSEKNNLSAGEELTLPVHIRLAKMKGRRFIKSHLGFSMLHPQLLEVGCKVVFIVRNIKDVFISSFFYPKWHIPDHELQEKLKHLWLIFKKDLTNFGNYFQSLKEAWEKRQNKNLLVLFYEEVNKDKRGAIQKVADFLNVPITNDQLDKLVHHVDIKNFKTNTSVNNDHLVNLGLYVKTDQCSFIRNGKCGSWRETFTPEMNAEFDDWIRDNLEKIPGFVMPECWKETMDMNL